MRCSKKLTDKRIDIKIDGLIEKQIKRQKYLSSIITEDGRSIFKKTGLAKLAFTK